MIDIKEVRQALEYIKKNCYRKSGNAFAYSFYEIQDLEDIKTLDQFITDTESLIKENEELKKSFHCDICEFNEENCKETCEYNKSLHDSQKKARKE